MNEIYYFLRFLSDTWFIFGLRIVMFLLQLSDKYSENLSKFSNMQEQKVFPLSTVTKYSYKFNFKITNTNQINFYEQKSQSKN